MRPGTEHGRLKDMDVERAGTDTAGMRGVAGMVVAVSSNGAYEFSKPVRGEITLIAGLGVEGDVHAGVTVRHRSRVRADPAQPNLRQVHLMRAELFQDVRADGYDVGPGQLGDNVTTSGIDLLSLPCGTILRFGVAGAAEDGAGAASRAADAISGVLDAAATARLDEAATRAVAALVAAAERVGDDPRPAVVVTGLRNPCGQIDGFRPGLLKKVLGRDADGEIVRRAGVMGVVLRGGAVRPGDPIDVEPPPTPHQRLERV